jgi:hypothetical protein
VVDVRAKGAKAETDAKIILKKHTGLGWERIPASGALDPKHGLKGDLYLPNKDNVYCVEVKHYSDCHIDHTLISGKNPQLIEWIIQAKRQALQTNRKWLLIFKHDRSKLFVAFEDLPIGEFPFIFINKNGHEFYISLLEDYLINNSPRFIRG